jgi:hypothetical protein
MSALKAANLALRFALELCALAAVAYWLSRVRRSREVRARTRRAAARCRALAASYAVNRVLIAVWDQ